MNNIISFVVWGTLTLLLIVAYSQIIRRSIKQIAQKVSKMANGDLTSKIPVNQKSIFFGLCNNINTLLLNVRRLINESTTMTDKVINHCEDLSKNTKMAEEAANYSFKTISQVSSEMCEQLDGTKHSETLVFEIMDEHKEIMQSGIDIENMATSMINTVQEGTSVYEELIAKLNMSAQSNVTLSSKIKSLNDKAQSIQSIADKVTDISRSTALLSFNAAIEAAKANEAGLGFSVVAEEIRKLSHVSSLQAKEIQNIIDEIKLEINDISSQMNSEVETIHRNIAFSNVTKENLSEILVRSRNTLNSARDINKIIELQNKKISVIRGTISQTANIAVNTTAATQEVTASTENQLSAATNVFNSISKLTDMNRSLKENIASFAKNFVITDEINKYIDEAFETLRDLSGEPDLSLMDYHICTNLLRKSIIKYPRFELFGLIDKNGLRKAITLNYPENEVYASFSHRPYFKESIKGAEYRSKPYISADTINYCIAIAVPVKYHSGEIAGVLMGDLILG